MNIGTIVDRVEGLSAIIRPESTTFIAIPDSVGIGSIPDKEILYLMDIPYVDIRGLLTELDTGVGV